MLESPRLLWHTRAPAPIWRLWPLPGFVALELRDQVARQVSFQLLTAGTGSRAGNYHDPAAPWWLALAGADAQHLWLDELNPAQFGAGAGRRQHDWATGALVARATPPQLPGPPPAAVGAGAVYRAGESVHFASLARFIQQRTGTAPRQRIEYHEAGPWLVLAADAAPGTQSEAAGGRPEHELLICAAADGRPVVRQALGPAAPGPEAGLFCTFGPSLYAVGAAGELLAWYLPLTSS